jgi:hypothetical protein
MAFPITKIEIAFNDGPYVASPTWTDVTTDVRSLSVKRGRSDDYSQFPTSSATVVLSNRTEKYNPLNTAGVYYNKLLPRRQIRIQAKVNAGSGYQDVWRGYISGWPVSWTQAGLDSTVTIQCFDMLGLLANDDLPVDEAFKTINALAPLHWWRCNDPEGSLILTDLGANALPISAQAGSISTQLKNYDSLAIGLPFKSADVSFATWNTDPLSTLVEPVSSVSLGAWVNFQDKRIIGSGTSFYAEKKDIVVYIGLTSTGQIKSEIFTATTAYTITSTSTIFSSFVPRHIFVTWNNSTNTAKIYVDGVNVAATTTSTAFPILNGRSIYGMGLQCFQDMVVFDKVLTDAEIANIFNASVLRVEQTTAARATSLMQQTSIPAGLYNITTTPQGTVSEIPVTGMIVTELQKTADSEGGDVFIDKSGVLQFTNRSYAPAQGASADVITFDDSPGSNPYGQNLDVEYTADDISNDLVVTFSGGGSVRQTNTSSQTASGVVSTTIDTYLSSIAGANELATYEIAIRSVLKPQVSAIEASVARTETQWYDVLNLELLSPFTITRTPPAGTVFTQKMIVNSISHDISPSGWRTSIQGSARYANWFVLDYSALDGPDLLL